MAKSVKKQIQECKRLLESYKKHLDLPNSLPHSIALIRWSKRQEDFNEGCNKAVDGLIPTAQASQDQVDSLKDEYQVLSQKATQVINSVAEHLNKWEQFQQRMSSVEEWLIGSHEEMNDISQYYKHLLNFQDMEYRYGQVQNELEKNKQDYEILQRDIHEHFNAKPSQEADESAGGDHEYIQFKLKWNRFEQSWNELNVKIHEFPAGKLLWQKIATLYSELNEDIERIEEHKTEIDERLKKKLDKSPRQTLEGYQQLKRELSSDQKQNNLTELDKLVKAHVTEKLISSHLPVKEFATLTDQLQDKWKQLILSVDKCIKNATNEMDSWEKKALECMQCCDKPGRSRLDDDHKGGHQPPAPPPPSATSCTSMLKRILVILARLIVILVLLIAALVVPLLFHLDEYTWYSIFYHLQQRLSFIELESLYTDYS